MDATYVKDHIAENEQVRRQQVTHERDQQAQFDWDKLLELAFNTPGHLVTLAREHAPQAAARVGAPGKV